MRISPKELEALAGTKTDRIELYTEAYADAFDTDKQSDVLNIYKDVATEITQLGIGINAGHDLDLENLHHFVQSIPNVAEVSIGHALICDALQFGLQDTMAKYLACLKNT